MNRLHADFRALAAARKIMARAGAMRTLADDRTGAERFIARFGSSLPAAAPASARGAHATTVFPAPGAATAGPRVFYIHGGGMVYYSTATFRPLLQFWADRLGTAIEAFDYLKAPEHDAGAAIARLGDDIASQLALEPGRPVMLAGDSVGALLALYIATRILPGAFRKLCLIYPVLEVHVDYPSYRHYGEGFFLDAGAMQRFRAVLAPWCLAKGFDPFALGEADLASLPDCRLFSAGCDVLSDEAHAWENALREQGRAVHHHPFLDLPHDFCLYFGKLPAAERAVLHILSTLK
jgi:acetyl esterase